MSKSDIDNLIFKLRELYFLAGLKLKPIELNLENQSSSAVIDLRNELIAELQKGKNSMRELLPTLKNMIESKWLIN